MQPGVFGMNAFCTDLLRYLLPSMKDNHLFRRIVVKSFPTHGVSAIGLKLEGVEGSSIAAGFPSSFTEATFHWAGTCDCAQQMLKRSCRAVSSAGHLLNTTYRTPSRGEEVDLVLDHFTAAAISSNVISSQLNSVEGEGGKGIHSG